MRIIVSKAYLKWRNANKGNIALSAIDKFLARVAVAPDATSIVPKPKAVGNNLRKKTVVVYEFALAKEYRVYARWLELTPGVVTFCLAIVGSKGMKNQSNDILTAQGMFDDVNAVEWEEWKPSADLAQSQAPAESVEPELQVEAPDNTTPDVKPKKRKGKPVDENGLSVAQRKELQKRQRQEQIALARLAKEQKRLVEQQEKLAAQQREEEQKRLAAQQEQVDNPPVSESPVATDVTVNDVEPVVQTPAPESAPDSHKKTPATHHEVVATAQEFATDSATVTPNAQPKRRRKVEHVDENGITTAESVEPVVQTPAPESAPDSVPAVEPAKPTVDTPDFKDYADIQYQLEIIEHKMNIERLNIKIIKQEISVAQREIALEELAMQRLELLRMKNTKSM